MKNLISWSLISIKLSLLLCFTVMGTFSGENVLATVEPCHGQTDKSVANKECSACEISAFTWSQDFIEIDQKITLETQTQEIFLVMRPWFEDKTQSTILSLSTPDPPERPITQHQHLIFQKGIQLII